MLGVRRTVSRLLLLSASPKHVRFPEARAPRGASINALERIGKEAIPWIKEGLVHSHAAVREAFRRALKACGGKPWWRFW